MKYIFFIAIGFLYNCSKFNPFRSKPNIAVLILARSGSKGVPLKNLATINNMTLIRRSLNTIKPLLYQKKVESIWVSTDHQLIAEDAVNVGAQIHWRDPHFATDTATSISAVKEFIRAHANIQVVILVQCTSPFLKTRYIIEALAQLSSSMYNIQCIFSVTRTFKLRWKEISGRVLPENFDVYNRPRRQDWQGDLIENGMFYIASRELIERDLLQDTSCSFVEIPMKDSFEIDSLWDLQLTRQITSIS